MMLSIGISALREWVREATARRGGYYGGEGEKIEGG